MINQEQMAEFGSRAIHILNNLRYFEKQLGNGMNQKFQAVIKSWQEKADNLLLEYFQKQFNETNTIDPSRSIDRDPEPKESADNHIQSN